MSILLAATDFDNLTWPGAFAISSIAAATAYVLGQIVKRG